MTHSLYAIVSTPDADAFRITKLSLDYEPLSSYLTTLHTCECPGFASRQRCRHHAILREAMRAAQIDSGAFLEFESAPIGWHVPAICNELNAEKIAETTAESTAEGEADAESTPTESTTPAGQSVPSPLAEGEGPEQSPLAAPVSPSPSVKSPERALSGGLGFRRRVI